jgi:hypothetical protein
MMKKTVSAFDMITGFVAKIDPVKLNSDAYVPTDADFLEAFGWGCLSFGANNECNEGEYNPKVPHTVDLKYITNGQCLELYRPNGAKDGDIYVSFLCVMTGITGTGFGDSGKQMIVMSPWFRNSLYLDYYVCSSRMNNFDFLIS